MENVLTCASFENERNHASMESPSDLPFLGDEEEWRNCTEFVQYTVSKQRSRNHDFYALLEASSHPNHPLPFNLS